MITIKGSKNSKRITYISEDGAEAYLRFEILDRRIVDAKETFVPNDLRHQGIASLLVQELLHYCASEGLLVRPSCSYVAYRVQGSEQWATLLESADNSDAVVEEFFKLSDPKQAQILQRFFKTGKGKYGEGDVFLGIRVPQTRAFAKAGKPWSMPTIEGLLTRKEHEVRFLGFIILAEEMKRTKDKAYQKTIYDCYMAHRKFCNNWDLVDLSAPYIVAIYLEDKPTKERIKILLKLAREEHLWSQRIAMVSCLGFIRQGSAEETLVLAEELLGHKHDLMHKAVGWMLREMGKRLDETLLRNFLDQHIAQMSRTTLRYAIERLSPEMRQHYLKLPIK